MSNARNIANLPNGDDAPIYACRAWVNFQGTSGTTTDNKTIRGSGNVSSVYENLTGSYTVNFETDMPDANYCAVATGGDNPGTDYGGQVATFGHATNSFSIYCSTPYAIGLNDLTIVQVAVFR